MLLADDNLIVCEGVRALLALDPGRRPWQALGNCVVKGRESPVKAYRLSHVEVRL